MSTTINPVGFIYMMSIHTHFLLIVLMVLISGMI